MPATARSPTAVLLLIGYSIPGAGLVLAFPEHRGAGLALLGLWFLAIYRFVSSVASDLGTNDGRSESLLRPTAARLILAPVAAGIFAIACCYWPRYPPDQGHGGWISFSTWPAVTLLLVQHPVATGSFLLILGYTTSAATIVIASRGRAGLSARNVRAAALLVASNLLVLLLINAIYSALSARRF